MELNLQALAPVCCITNEPFGAGERVASFLSRDPGTGELRRDDAKADAAADFSPPGQLVCKWVQVFKPKPVADDPQRRAKLTAENLFLTLADPAAEQSPENARLVQFLALMLERKKVLRPRGRSADGARTIVEHGPTRQRYEVPAGEMDAAFFTQIHSQLGSLFGEQAS